MAFNALNARSITETAGERRIEERRETLLSGIRYTADAGFYSHQLTEIEPSDVPYLESLGYKVTPGSVTKHTKKATILGFMGMDYTVTKIEVWKLPYFIEDDHCIKPIIISWERET